MSTLNKLGWASARNDLVSFILNKKLVHVLVVFLTVILIFINYSAKTKADTLISPSRNTILAGLVKSEFSAVEDNQDFIVESFDNGVVTPPKQLSYVDKQGTVNSQMGVKIGQTDEEGASGNTQNNSSVVRPVLPATQVTKRPRTEIIEYTVEEGDSISTIADNFDISVNTILWENNLSAYSVIRPGMSLSILPVSGVAYIVERGDTLGSIATKFNIPSNDILDINKIADASMISVGKKIVIPGGEKESLPKYKPTTYTGFTAIKHIIEASNEAPADQTSSSDDTSDEPPVSGNKMAWPTQGHTITQYYSWRHTGLDIANKVGTPLYAADSGVVETAGWGTGYGNHIVINHGGGKETLYGHASKLFVQVGDKVKKGETIAAMGSTGWSTGPHIHFEVRINGQRLNPLNYIR